MSAREHQSYYLRVPTHTSSPMALWSVLMVIPLLWLSCTLPTRTAPVAVQGQMDLSDWNFDRDGIIALDGEWEFYWQKLYQYSNFHDSTAPQLSGYRTVPGLWNFWEHNGSAVGSFGYATYRLRVKLRNSMQMLGMAFHGASSAYRMFVEDRMVMSSGVVSDNPDAMQPEYRSQFQSFVPYDDTITIIVQVANNFHFKGGLWESIQLGSYEQVLNQRSNIRMWDAFYVGALFILAVYHFWIYFFHKNELTSLYFAISCCLIALRVTLTGEQILYTMFNRVGSNILLRIEYADLCLMYPMFLLFFSNFLLTTLPQLVKRISFGIAGVWMLLIVATPTHIYTVSLTLFNTLGVGAILYVLALVIQPSRRRNDVPLAFFVAFTIMILAVVNDVLYAGLWINTGYAAQYTFLFFMLVQAYILSSNLAKNFLGTEKLSQQLQEINTHLEETIHARTKEIEGEKKRSDDLLYNILPVETAHELKTTGRARPKTYGMVTVLFTDFKDFSTVSEQISPELLVTEIDACFSAFDEIIERYGLEKIKTVGDAYLCVAGIPVPTQHDAIHAVQAAREIRDFMAARFAEKQRIDEQAFEVRIGIHTGPIVAGVVGKRKFAYDIWGDAVNVAARMEQNSDAGKINISGSTYNCIKGRFSCTYRGNIEVKNKGHIEQYYVDD